MSGAGELIENTAQRFTNWSGSVSFVPNEWVHPTSAQELQTIIQRAGNQNQTVRPVGSGHSSMPLMNTDDVLVSLGEMTGVVSTNRDKHLATVLPGTGLADLGAGLAEHGLGMENLGDVDYQAIAGAIATGTHGSGIRLGNLSSTLIGGTLLTGTGTLLPFGVEADGDSPKDGEHIEVDTQDLLRAAQVSLGALGILTSLTLRCEPSYELHRLNWMTHIDWVFENFAELIETNRSVDFYWYPRSDLAQVRMLNKPGEEPAFVPPGELRVDETGPSYQIIPNQRDLRFEEMEYMLPLDTSLAAFQQVRQRIKDKHRARVGWRVLVRTIAQDDAMLSNAHSRPTMTIALLHNNTLPHEEYFSDMEPLLQSFDGRPHWGKKHTMNGSQLAEHYPDWEQFLKLRETLDPDGVFLNEYLKELFEL